MHHLQKMVAAAAVVALAGAGASAHAQSASSFAKAGAATDAAAPGSIQGSVVDDRGAPLRGVAVSAVGESSALVLTDARGQFVIGPLAPGTYVIRAHKAGFAASSRETVSVSASQRVSRTLALRRPSIQLAGVATTGDAAVVPEPATTGAPDSQPQPEASEESPDDDHSPLAWHLRHIARNPLKDVNGGGAVTGDVSTEDIFDPEVPSFFGRTVGSSARFAASLFAEIPFTGQFNLMTTGSFQSPQDLFSSDNLPRGVAYVSIGAPAGRHGEWAVQGALTQGDVSSWIMAGSYTTKNTSAHQLATGMSYSMQRYDGGNPFALTAVSAAARNVGALHAFDNWKVSERAAITYGARYAWYDYVDKPGLFSPAASLTFVVADKTRVKAGVSQRMLAPGAEEFLPSSTSGPWLPPERTFSTFAPNARLRAQRTRNVELSLERDLDEHVVVGVRKFSQEVTDQLVTLFGVSMPSADRSELGHYFVATVGRVDMRGYGLVLRRTLSPRFEGSVEYTIVDADWSPSVDAVRVAGNAPSAARARHERFHDVTGVMETQIPEIAARVYLALRLNSAFANSADTVARPGLDTRFDLQVNQALPFSPFPNTEWELLLAVRNLFRETLGGDAAYDELLVVRPPKRLVGGLLVRF